MAVGEAPLALASEPAEASAAMSINRIFFRRLLRMAVGISRSAGLGSKDEPAPRTHRQTGTPFLVIIQPRLQTVGQSNVVASELGFGPDSRLLVEDRATVRFEAGHAGACSAGCETTEVKRVEAESHLWAQSTAN